MDAVGADPAAVEAKPDYWRATLDQPNLELDQLRHAFIAVMHIALAVLQNSGKRSTTLGVRGAG